MFGPGLEQLDDSLVTRMMTSPDLLPVVSILQRQIDGESQSRKTYECTRGFYCHLDAALCTSDVSALYL